jgi:hypothetical protein
MLSIWAFFTPPNYVYSITRIQPEQLGELSLFLGSVFFLFKTKSWWKHNSKRVLLFTPFISLFIFLIIRIWPQDYFLIITGEDQLVEYLQFFVLLFGSGILCYQLIRYYSQLNKFVLFSMLVLAFSFIFLAGEEISWGQRILNLTSSEYMVKNNLQGEITLHNLDYIQWTVEIAYVVIGILGGTLWLIKKTKIHLPPYINWLIPSSYLFAFFIIPGIYYAYPVYSGKNLIREWAEVMELFLYAGIVLHAITMNNLIIPKLTKHPQIKK